MYTIIHIYVYVCILYIIFIHIYIYMIYSFIPSLCTICVYDMFMLYFCFTSASLLLYLSRYKNVTPAFTPDVLI
jgi:hypothetical protein